MLFYWPLSHTSNWHESRKMARLWTTTSPIIVTVIKYNIPVHFLVRCPSTLTVSRKGPIFCVPFEPFFSHSHTLYLLSLVTIGFEQHERSVCGKDNTICRMTVCTAAVLDQGVVSVFPIWQCTSIAVIVVCVFVIPADIPFSETCKRKRSACSLPCYRKEGRHEINSNFKNLLFLCIITIHTTQAKTAKLV